MEVTICSPKLIKTQKQPSLSWTLAAWTIEYNTINNVWITTTQILRTQKCCTLSQQGISISAYSMISDSLLPRNALRIFLPFFGGGFVFPQTTLTPTPPSLGWGVPWRSGRSPTWFQFPQCKRPEPEVFGGPKKSSGRKTKNNVGVVHASNIFICLWTETTLDENNVF